MTNNAANFGHTGADELIKSKNKEQTNAKNPYQKNKNEDLTTTKKNIEDGKNENQDESNDKDEKAEENGKIDLK